MTTPTEAASEHTMKTKQQIVCDAMGVSHESSSFGDAGYVSEFESRFGELTEQSFGEFMSEPEFCAWVEESGY